MALKARNSESSEGVDTRAEAQEQDRPLDPTREELIRSRAYEIYMARGAAPGHDVKDWLQAEFELTTDPKAAGE